VVAGEKQHEAGRQGVVEVRRWLDSTTRFTTLWDVYGTPDQTIVKLPGGAARGFDIAGYLRDEDGKAGPKFYAEVKRYSSASGQQQLYEEYLAVSYAATLEARSADHDPATEFLWVTWHPFSQGKYLKLTEPPEIKAACKKHEALLGGEAFDQTLADTLAKRLWLLIVNQRQADMTMSKRNLAELQKLSTMAAE
jgi:hypothetical protein